MKKYLLSAFAIVALLCVACGGGGDDAPTTMPVSGIKLDKSSLSLEIGEKATVTATIAPADATNKSITWSIANQTIATVSNGVVTGVATGETTITAKTNDGGYSATIPVKVLPKTVKVTEIKLVGVPAETEKGRSTTFSAVITPADATDMSVTFTSSNPEVATVEFTKAESNYSLALLKAVGNGKATITATANDGSGVKATAEVEVVGVEPTALTINGQTKAEIYTWHGNTVELDIATTPAGADLTRLNWQFTDPYSEFDVLQYSVTSDKVTVNMYYPKNTGYLTGGDIRVWSSDYSTLLASVDVYCQTLGWLFKKKSNGDTNYLWPFTDVSATQQYTYNWNLSATNEPICFNAFYYTNGYTSNADPELYYEDMYIPNSAYTLTSSAPDKLKVTREADGVGYKLERLDTTSLVAVTLTYTCGRHTQTYTINLIP